MVFHNSKLSRGFSLLEVLIVSAILSLFFTGLFGSLKYTLALIADSKAKLTALTVANDQMEYIRSLSYNAVGTVSGIPSGAIPQVSTSTLNNIVFEKRVLVEYIDDDADGLGSSDSNLITTDYKQAKVTVSWTQNGVARSVFLVSNIIPVSIESDVGGGTVQVKVYDAIDNSPLPGATVRLVNDALAPTIDVSRTTDATGIALFGGAPAGAEYEVFVTAPGYSSDQTYRATTTLPAPTKLPFAVLEADVATQNFFISELSDLTLRTLSDKVENQEMESFVDSTGIVTSLNTSVSSGSLVLSDTAGVYAGSGSATVTLTPSTVVSWNSLLISGVVPIETTAVVHVYSASTTPELISESELPGNAAGFPVGTISLSALDPLAYPALTFLIELTTASSTLTPRVNELTVTYIESETVRSNVALTMTGARTIGTNNGVPVYKNDFSVSTDGDGEYTFSEIEADNYTVSSVYDIAEACPAYPIALSPDITDTVDLLLVGDATHTLRVVTLAPDGTPLPDAMVTLRRLGIDQIETTGSCGQAFFSPLTEAIDYELEVTASGFGGQTFIDFVVSGDGVTVVQF